MPNFPGNKAYPLLAGPTAMVDAGQKTKHLQTGLARGGTVEDFNARLRGVERRADKKPRKPYP